MIKPDDLIAEIFRGVFEEPPKVSTSVWADEHRQIVVGSVKGRWVTDRVPALRGPMDAISDPAYRQVTFVKATQGGGTEAAYNGLLRIIDVDPGDTLFVYPNTEMARRVNRRRFLPTLRRCGKVAARLGEKATDAQSLELVFDRMTLTWAGSNSEANLEVFPYRFVFVDELDRCAPTTLEQVRERVKTFSDSKIVVIGSPGLLGAGIDREYQGEMDEDGNRRGGSDQRKFFVPCPKCGAYQLRLWRNVRWDGGLKAPPAVVRATAWMVCSNARCGEKIEAEKNLWQQRLGVWARKGEGVSDLAGEEPGKLLGGEKLPLNDHAGFALGGLYSALESNPYGSVAAKYVVNQGESTQGWVTRTVGEAFAPRGDAADIKELKARKGRTGLRFFDQRDPSWTLPAWALVVTMGVDVQGDRMWVEYLAWGAQGKDLFGFLVVEVPRKTGLDLVELDAWAVKGFRTADGRTLRPLLVGIDTGDFTDECYSAVKRISRIVPHCRGVKGEYKDRTDIPQQYSKTVEREQGLKLLLVNVNYWKDHILARLRPGLKKDDEFSNPAAPAQGVGVGVAASVEADDQAASPDVWHFGSGTPDVYLEHLTSEHCVARRLEGRIKWVWERRPGREHNHLLDCRVYGCALAAMEGVRTLRRRDEKSEEKSAGVGAGARKEERRESVSATIAEARSSGMLAAARR